MLREGSCPPVQPREGSSFHVLHRERLPFPCQSRSLCWESQFGVCVQHTSALKARRPTNTRQNLLLPPLSFGSPSARPQPTICMVRAPQVCHPPSSPWLENPLSPPPPPPPVSKPQTLPRPVDTAAPPLLLVPSFPPWPISPLAPPGSLLPPAPPWSVIHHLSARDSTPPSSPRPSGSVRLLLPFDSTFVLCCSGSTVAYQIPASVSVAWAIGSALVLRILPSPWLIGSRSLLSSYKCVYCLPRVGILKTIVCEFACVSAFFAPRSSQQYHDIFHIDNNLKCFLRSISTY